MNFITEEPRQTPVAYDCDLCVIGGSATGVFAAVRAARLGLRVALVEENILLGGMAVAAQVNEWHRIHDAFEQEQIIGGLTVEVLDRLKAKGAVDKRSREIRGTYYVFNSAELALQLDELIQENNIRCFLKCRCVDAHREGNRITAALIEDKSGRRAITARQFIDASGDGDLLRRGGFEAWQEPVLQPVMYQMLGGGLNGLREKISKNPWADASKAAIEMGYPAQNSAPWINSFPAAGDVNNIYGPRQQGVDASDADQLSSAIMTGRRHFSALFEGFAKTYGRGTVAPLQFAHAMGVRETWHARCLVQLRAEDMLSGAPVEDSIARGTYPVDVHSPEGTLLRHLDGREEVIDLTGKRTLRRWCAEGGDGPAYYHIPYRCLVPRESENLLIAGRLIDADREGFGGVRVMVNMNQCGEAAGVAATLAIQQSCSVAEVDIPSLRTSLAEGGSLMS